MNRNIWLTEVVKPHLGTVRTAVEVGVWRADYSATIIALLQPEQFYGVDPYSIRPDYIDKPDPTEFANQQNLDALCERVCNRFQNWGQNLLRNTGIEAAQRFEDNSLDFVYIDGDHTYDFVSGDIRAWWPKVRSGGILSGHDYTPGNPEKGHVYGVIEAVDEHCAKYQLEMGKTAEQYATWWCIKP